MVKKIKMGLLLVWAMSLVAVGSLVAATADNEVKGGKVNDDVFYIYFERGSRLNHYAPSGWMGDFGDLKLNQGWIKESITPEAKTGAAKTGSDHTCIQIKYTAEKKQGAGWAGMYWQHPANNWGDKPGGYNLSNYSKLTFQAKGELGGEVIDKCFIGGITGTTEEGDSDQASVSPVKLTKEWKAYEISLKGLDLSHIIGGFGFAINADANPKGATFYISDIKLEK